MKSIAKSLAISLLGTVFASSPLLAQDKSIDYDHAVQFNKLKSYTYAKVQASDPLVEPRLTAAVDRVLQGMGMHLVDKNADVSIAVIDATISPTEYSRFYNSLTGDTWTRGWGAGGFSDTSATLDQIPVGTLVIDMYDKSGKLVWRGTAAQPPVSKQRKAEDNVDKAVNTLFTKFPPKTGGDQAPNQVEVPASASSKATTGPS